MDRVSGARFQEMGPHGRLFKVDVPACRVDLLPIKHVVLELGILPLGRRGHGFGCHVCDWLPIPWKGLKPKVDPSGRRVLRIHPPRLASDGRDIQHGPPEVIRFLGETQGCLHRKSPAVPSLQVYRKWSLEHARD